mmetsp:Transcript_56219/g.122958  ORF Transcript_56219/g.122958 Transcript_56219/m.122958 type:complete len:201 (+) Transcript_56219:1225-1827(+)
MSASLSRTKIVAKNVTTNAHKTASKAPSQLRFAERHQSTAKCKHQAVLIAKMSRPHVDQRCSLSKGLKEWLLREVCEAGVASTSPATRSATSPSSCPLLPDSKHLRTEICTTSKHPKAKAARKSSSQERLDCLSPGGSFPSVSGRWPEIRKRKAWTSRNDTASDITSSSVSATSSAQSFSNSSSSPSMSVHFLRSFSVAW